MDDTTVSTNEESKDPSADLKTRFANLLINRVALSECLNVIRDACIQRAGELIDTANDDQMGSIVKDLEAFENPPTKEEGEVAASGPVTGSSPVASGPVNASGPQDPADIPELSPVSS
jgi:hypothetical protein